MRKLVTVSGRGFKPERHPAAPKREKVNVGRDIRPADDYMLARAMARAERARPQSKDRPISDVYLEKPKSRTLSTDGPLGLKVVK